MLGSARIWLGPGLLLLAALWLMGLGGGTEGAGGGPNIPIPQENFTVTITDRSEQTLEARRFTWEGKVHLRGQVGNATVSLPFSKLRSLTVQPASGEDAADRVKASIALRSGDTVEVMIDSTSKCYGETKFGTYEIFLKDVTRIEFQ